MAQTQERQVESISMSEQSKALVLTAKIHPPPSSWAKPDKSNGLMNVKSKSGNHNPPTPTVYTKFILPVSRAIAGNRGIEKPQTQTTSK